ncbi:MAG: DNA methyltransferase [Akkermansiaceae bacterium]
MRDFRDFGKSTIIAEKTHGAKSLPVYVNEFWTAKQRAAHSLHEVSYRACFKPQLPRFFIERFTTPGERVYDPFMGRGTTLLESALLGRVPIGCDINPLSAVLCLPRMKLIDASEVEKRLHEIDLGHADDVREDLLVFYHPDTLRELCSLREYFIQRAKQGMLDDTDAWIRMVATNRLTGHSPGFFSVYTLPPNQAVSIASQIRINEKRQQVPTRRDIRRIIIKKSNSLLKDLSGDEKKNLQRISKKATCITASCAETPDMPSDSVSLVVTSPPFLDIVQYDQDNWLRCWFNGIDSHSVPIWQLRTEDAWQQAMSQVFRELQRILVKGGVVAFEVGEVRKGRVLLEDLVLPAAEASGLQPFAIMINDQDFTKTSNCWGVDNASKGTNTNRIILLRKTSDPEQLNLL